MITEAGLIGKIGLNSSHVGVCFNALTSPGIDARLLPAHLALRLALESESAVAAVRAIEAAGVASACYILVGDEQEAIGLECTSRGIMRQEMDEQGRCWHTNHMILDHGGDVVDRSLWPDSRARLARMGQLLPKVDKHVQMGNEGTVGEVNASMKMFEKAFEDEEGFPVGICRKSKQDVTDAETLFNITMDLKRGTAVVRIGRPTEMEGRLDIGFSRDASA